MDAKTFLNNKHDAAVEELKALEADYAKRKQAAQAAIDMAKKWLDELGGPEVSRSEPVKPEPDMSVQDFAKKPTDSWVSSRDLTARIPRTDS